ncbi:MAG: YhbY family RNA-binding protein [Spirochaetales bacterium]|nr:YhbY family RNA-binding protein [Spirochaetales bacterium]
MNTLSGKQRSYLTRQSQKLKPVVFIGKNGPTESAIAAVASALEHHELIKVKFVDLKDLKKDISLDIAQKTGAVMVRVIGNIALFYKENPDKRQYSLPQ